MPKQAKFAPFTRTGGIFRRSAFRWRVCSHARFGTRVFRTAFFPSGSSPFMIPFPEPVRSKTTSLFQAGSSRMAQVTFELVGISDHIQACVLEPPGVRRSAWLKGAAESAPRWPLCLRLSWQAKSFSRTHDMGGSCASRQFRRPCRAENDAVRRPERVDSLTLPTN